MLQHTYSREEIESAIDAYDEYSDSGHHAKIFDNFQNPRKYWVQSTRERLEYAYPTKPIVGFLREQAGLRIGHNGGWTQNNSAATLLYNSGFIIVDGSNKPVKPPKQEYTHFISNAEFIRACARNYYNEPARERGDQEVKICSQTLSTRIGLHRPREVYKALDSDRLRPRDVPAPTTSAGPPDDSPAVVFTYPVPQLTSPPISRSNTLPQAVKEFQSKIKNLPKNTVAVRLACQRVGQDIFRNRLIAHWKGKCPLTGIKDQSLLRASHIKPWSKCNSDEERLDVHNGLLLSALWDLAFDKGLVTFEVNGKPKFSDTLSKDARDALHWKKRIKLTVKQKKQLAWHRANVFEKNNFETS